MDHIDPDSGRAAQVCDRCRIKKIGCDGNNPSCAKCTAAGVQCTRTTSLLRKTKPRRHGKTKVDEVERLRSHIIELRSALDERTWRAQTQQPPGATGSTPTLHANASPLHFRNVESTTKSRGAQGSVIKHLGRLVSVAPGQDFFAGSTTGVHFVRSVEQKWQHMSESNQPFADLFFKMHLLVQPAMLSPFPNSLCTTAPTGIFSTTEHLELPEEYYTGRLQRYLSRWNTVFPVFCRKQISHAFSLLLRKIKTDSASSSDFPDLYCLFLILALDAWDANGLSHNEHALRYYRAAVKLESEALELLNLQTVQCRILKVMYLHLSGRHGLVSCEMGSTVRAAQCIGLHRQSRRFKLCAGEAECRTRLWWCVSILDILTCTAYGLPKLISNVDVDVLLPADCDFDDIHAAELTVPLPGERTQAAPFIALVKLHLILQQATQLLFTTTERRDGEAKIGRLERQLRVWRQENADLTEPGGYFANFLDLMGYFSMLLIHQPGLTIDENGEQVDRSITMSLESALGILDVLTQCKHERRLIYLQPNATRMACQSALMCLYYTWHTHTTDFSSFTTHITQSLSLESAVELACDLLKLNRCDLDANDATADFQSRQAAQRDLDHAITALRSMTEQTYTSLGQSTSARSEPLSDLERVIANDSTIQDSTDAWMGDSSLWDLNTASLEEWSEGLRLESMDHYLPEFSLD